jgi:hypothetical protein
MRRVYVRNLLVLLAALLAGVGVMGRAAACSNNLQSCSSGWGVSETYFGTGGSLDTTCSSGSVGYCAKQSAGETAVGDSASTLYQAQAGFNTDRTPSLALLVNDASCQDYQSGGVNLDLDYLSTSSTKTANANFSIKTYLASSYSVVTSGSAPVSNGSSPHLLTTLTSGGSSTTGTEQFGINLVANTSPAIGHNVQQLPDSSFGFGGPTNGYGTANTFKYNNGDTIASSSQSSGTTCYDISYIFNISSLTPSGYYSFNQSIVATSTF